MPGFDLQQFEGMQAVKTALAIALLFAGVACAQTSGPVTYFVNASGGSDANACTQSTDACLTIQGAVNKIPKTLEDLVTVSIAEGSYAGFYVSGFTQDLGHRPATAGLYFTGTLTDTDTGTATGGSTGSNGVFGTLTDTSKSWTPDQQQGRLLALTSGTGAPATRVVVSNTATTLTIAGTWSTAPVSGTAYALRDSATVVSGPIDTPPSGTESAVAGAQLVLIAGNAINYRNSALAFQNLKFAPPSGSAMKVNDGSAVRVSSSQFALNGGSGLVVGDSTNLASGASVRAVDSSFIDSGSTGNAISIFDSAGSFTRVFFKGGGGSVNAVACPIVAVASSYSTGTSGTVGAFAYTAVDIANFTSTFILSSGTAVLAQRGTGVPNFSFGMTVSGGAYPILIQQGARTTNHITADITCSSSAGAAVRVGDPQSGGDPGAPGSYANLAQSTVGSGCGAAMEVYGHGSVGSLQNTGVSGSPAKGLRVLAGGYGSYHLSGVGGLTPTGAQLELDNGVMTSTFAGPAPLTCVFNSVTGSRICRQ